MDTKHIIMNAMEPHLIDANHSEYIELLANKGIEDFIYITGDLLAQNNAEDKFKYLSWNYFLDYPMFIKKKYFNENFVNEFNFTHKILCYNRRPHVHRKILVYNILQNDLLKHNTLFSLGYNDEYNKKINEKVIESYIEDSKEAKRIFEYFTTLSKDIKIDDKDDFAENRFGLHMKMKDYQRTFVSLVTETLVTKDKLFFSEKTYKPIVAQHPFIILGNPNALKYLKSIGFKPFNKWWDESYDEETDFKKRFDKIMDILKNICSMSYDDLYSIRKEMNEVCIHNYKHFFKSTGVTPELKKLGFKPQIFPIINNKLI